MNNPALSVTVLNYNYGHYLPGCLNAILAQSLRDLEVIVIDDCSSDDSLAVVQPYLQDPRVRLVAHAENAGFARSLLEGTELHSRGEFVTVVSADDMVLDRDAFALQVDLLCRHPRTAFAFSAVQRMYDARPGEVHHSFPAETVLRPRDALQRLLLRPEIWPMHSGTVVRRSAYDACGGYRRDITMPLDLALWLDLAMEGGFAYLPEPLHGYRLHEGQMSGSVEGIRRNTAEVAAILRRAARQGAERGLVHRGLERPAVRAHLAGSVTFDAFAGNRRSAATRIGAGLLECPFETLTSRAMWLAAARTAVGGRAFAAARSARRRIGRPFPARASAQGGPL